MQNKTENTRYTLDQTKMKIPGVARRESAQSLPASLKRNTRPMIPSIRLGSVTVTNVQAIIKIS